MKEKEKPEVKKVQRPQGPPQVEKEETGIFTFEQPSPPAPASTTAPEEEPGTGKGDIPLESTAPSLPSQPSPPSDPVGPKQPAFSPAVSLEKLTDVVMPLLKKLKSIPPKKTLLLAGGLLLAILLIILAATLRGNPRPGTGSPVPRVTPTPTVEDLTPAVSPTPKLTPSGLEISAEGKIAFLKSGDLWLISSDGTGEVYLVQSSDSLSVQDPAHFNLPQQITDFSWSPDGIRIALVSGGDVWVINLNDRTRQRLTEHGEDESYQKPCWSPSGQLIAVERQVTKEIKGKKVKELTVSILSLTKVSSSQEHTLYEINSANYFSGENDTLDTFQFVDWFPNSGEVLTYRTGETISRGLWWLSFDKAIKERIVDLGAVGTVEAEIAKDGRNVVYIDEGDAWLIDVISRSKKVIAAADGSVARYQWPQFDHRSRLLKLNAVLSGTNQLYLAFYNTESGKTNLFWTGLSGTMENYSWSPSDGAAVFTTSQKVLWVLDVNTHEQNQVTTEAEKAVWNPGE